eukprot:4866386-Prymnesium_polylepis.2
MQATRATPANTANPFQLPRTTETYCTRKIEIFSGKTPTRARDPFAAVCCSRVMRCGRSFPSVQSQRSRLCGIPRGHDLWCAVLGVHIDRRLLGGHLLAHPASVGLA